MKLSETVMVHIADYFRNFAGNVCSSGYKRIFDHETFDDLAIA